MKILYINSAYWPAIQFGGPIVSIKLLAEDLVKFCHKVFVFTSAYGLEKNENRKIEINGVKVHYFKYFILHRWIISFELIKELWKRKNDFDIFHINLVWDPISWMSGFVLALANKEFIISPRGTIEEELIRKRSYFLKNLVYFLFIKFIFKKARGFHFTSEKEKEEFFKFSKIQKPYSIIFNHFNYQDFRKKVDKSILENFGLKDKKYILYFGRINWKKRIELLILAFTEFLKDNKDFYLAICGSADKDYFEKIKKLIEKLNLEDKIILIGQTIEGDKKLALYQNAFCFVLPSISENFGYVVVEAIASGVPIIISKGVGLKDILVKYNACLVFSGENEDELKNNLILKLREIQNDNLRENLIKNGFNFLEKEFKNEVLSQKMLEFYNSLLK